MNYKKQKKTYRQREEVTKRNQVHLLQNAKEVNLRVISSADKFCGRS